MIAFFVPCVPPKTSHHAKRIVRVGKWSRLADKPELVAARGMLDAVLLPHQPAQPVTGPVALALEFVWPWLASDPKRVRALGRVPHAAKPDCDNVAKTITDRLAALAFLGQDSHVVALSVTKWRGDTPGIFVRLEPLPAAPTAPSPRQGRSAPRRREQPAPTGAEPSLRSAPPRADARPVRNEVGQ